MTVFFIIILLAIILQIAARIGINSHKNFKDNARIATGVAFIFTGVSHFLIPEKFMQMMPPFLPAPLFLIYLSGAFEILGGIGLIIFASRELAAIGLIVLLLAVFPANIYVALENVRLGGFMNYAVYQWLRLPMQFVLIGWVWWCGEINKSGRKNYES
jgi:uncharacterized membrane protein